MGVVGIVKAVLPFFTWCLFVNSVSCKEVKTKVTNDIDNDDGVINYMIQPTTQLLLNEIIDTSNNNTSTSYNRYLSSKHNKKHKKNKFRKSSIHTLLDDLEQIKNHKQHDNGHSNKLAVLKENMNKFESSRYYSRYEHEYQAEVMRRNNRKLRINQEEVEVSEDRIQEVPLMQGLGTHYVTMWIGTPPQRKSAIVDTGSHYTAFPCAGCNNCGEQYHTDKYFDPDKSSTFHKLTCDECYTVGCDKYKQCYFSQGYSEGSSWRAYQARDKFFIGSNNRKTGGKNEVDQSYAVDFMFGCQTHETGLFISQLADGIMGLSADPATFPYFLYDQKKIKHKTFSLCFESGEDSSKDGVFAGLMTMGGRTTSSVLHSDMVYAKNIKPIGWATVRVRNIYVRKGGGNSARYYPNAEYRKLNIDANVINGSKGHIVDSGTTDTYFNSAVASEFRKVWKEYTGRNFNNDFFSMTDEEADMLPTILIQIEADDNEISSIPADHDRYNIVGPALDPEHPNDILIAISPYHYIEYANGKDKYVVRIYLSESNGGVLGANTMFHHSVYFDWENHRVGFAESTCNADAEYELIHPTGVAVEGTGVDEVHEEGNDESVTATTEETNTEDTELNIETSTLEAIPPQEEQDSPQEEPVIPPQEPVIPSETENVELPSTEEIGLDLPSSEETEEVTEEQDLIPVPPDAIRIPVPISKEVEQQQEESTPTTLEQETAEEGEAIEQPIETISEQEATEEEEAENVETPSVPEITINTEQDTTNQEGENDGSNISSSSLTTSTTTASSEKMTTPEVVDDDDASSLIGFFKNNLNFIASMVGVCIFVFFVGFFTVRRWENQDIASLTDGLNKKDLGKYSTLSQHAEDDYEGLDFHNDSNKIFSHDTHDDEDLEHIELT